MANLSGFTFTGKPVELKLFTSFLAKFARAPVKSLFFFLVCSIRTPMLI